MFTVDCRNVDIIFTDNETNSVRRRRVLYKRQLKNKKKCECERDEPVLASCAESTDAHADATNTSETASTTAVAGTAAVTTAHTAAELLSDDADADADYLSDADSDRDDEESDSLSGSQVLYTKDAFHKYIIPGQLMLLRL